MVDDDPARQPPLEFRDVAGLGRAVDDDVEMIAAARRHQIVNDSASLVEQHRIAQPPVLEHPQLARKQRLERAIDLFAGNDQLPHVADIEQPGMAASPQMFGDDPVILDRHRIARERHHPRAARTMPAIEWQELRR